jgi:hypothetical protein
MLRIVDRKCRVRVSETNAADVELWSGLSFSPRFMLKFVDGKSAGFDIFSTSVTTEILVLNNKTLSGIQSLLRWYQMLDKSKSVSSL